ncbi:CAP domain-containing protein [Virgibacillus kimchii]
MMKKLSIITALFTILFSGIFVSSAAASAQDQEQQHSYKVFYSINEVSINDVQEHLSGNEIWQHFLNKYEQPAWENNEKQADQSAGTQENPEQQEGQDAESHEQNVTEQEGQNAGTQEQNVTEQEEQNTDSNNAGELSQFEQEVVDLTNAERSKHGLSPLQADVELSKVAREKSRDMAANNYFDHNSPTYGSPFDMMQQFDVNYRTAGENIAKGQRSPQEVVDAWMNSEGHRANILNGDFTHIGVGYVEQGNHWTQMFIGR